MILLHLIGQFARYWLDPNFRDECDLEEALECEGEDGPTVARILERMRRRKGNVANVKVLPVPNAASSQYEISGRAA